MNNTMKSLVLTAAVSGLFGGTAARLNAQTAPAQPNTNVSATQTAHAGVLIAQSTDQDKSKHSCKGKNDCKGQGGGTDAGKNSCKGQGGCATDGSKPPSA